MTTPLDSTVAKVVFTARLLERAVHDPGPWTLSWGPHEVPAQRVLIEDGAIFIGEFPDVCHLERFDAPLILSCAGEQVDVRPMEWPGDCAFTVDWVIRGRLNTVFA